MKLIVTILFIIISICTCLNTYSQCLVKLDSLLNLLKKDGDDTLKLFRLNELSSEFERIGSYDSALLFDKSALKLCDIILEETVDLQIRKTTQKGKATTYNHIGNVYSYQSNYSEALKYYFASLKIREVIGDKKGLAGTYNNIGIVFDEQGNYPEALKYYFHSLKMEEELGNKNGIATSYLTIGSVYEKQENYPDALKNHLASLKISKEIGDITLEAYSYTNIGIVYTDQCDYIKALDNLFASIKLFEAIGDKRNIARTYTNIGCIYFEKANYTEALKNYFKGLKIKESIGDLVGMTSSYGNIGTVFINQKKYNEAEFYLNKAIGLSKEIGNKENLRDVYSMMTILDSIRGNYKGAYENHKLYMIYRDSLDNEETRKRTIQSQMTYDFEKKEAVANAEHKKELENQQALAEEKSRKQEVVIIFVLIGLLLVLVFSGFIFRSFRITRKQNSIIEKQKQMVDEKNCLLNQQNEEISKQRNEIVAQRDKLSEQNTILFEQKKEITDSINYAKRIQQAVLPTGEYANSILGEHFILFKPKDIVSGDFYWGTRISEWLIVTVADCTGHGVPGAFMSMLGVSFLNEIVRKKEIIQANQVLEELRISLIESLQQKGSTEEQKDGMDIVLCAINFSKNELQFSGANNSLYIVTALKELKEILPDKQPVGIHENMKQFTNHNIQINKGDCIFFTSDGYEDQFGGHKFKKFMSKQLKELFVNIADKQMDEQKNILETTFENWKGEHEQIDDVTVLGLKV